ncbi:hypothetical protein [Pseudomonas sp. OTU750018]|uniref:hypothetical protein n=1 Tax=Pseudomonas sp. OTU750018 TaxID=2709708 RepID=UPI001421CC2F|nr:hypothetical protein [Pseudomonas sp. OTU750018]
MTDTIEHDEMRDQYLAAIAKQEKRQATQPNRIPAGLYAELEALRTLRDAIRVYRDSYMRDEIEDEDSCVSVDQHDAACSVQAALESAQALEWKGGEQ